jgi:hypothetical protein
MNYFPLRFLVDVSIKAIININTQNPTISKNVSLLGECIALLKYSGATSKMESNMKDLLGD